SGLPPQTVSFTSLQLPPPAVQRVPLLDGLAENFTSVSLAFSTPGVLSPPVVSSKPAVKSFRFNSLVKSLVFAVSPASSSNTTSQPAYRSPQFSAALKSATRLHPLNDVVKLADRLQYVLQPSLETLVAQGSLHFPLHPFQYQ